MLAKNTKVIMKNKGQKPIQDIVKGDWVKTKYGDEEVTATLSQKREAYKFIFSDGFKVTVGDLCMFLTSTGEIIPASHLKEGDKIKKPDDNFATIVDITPLGEMELFDITTENVYYLSNGMCVQ